MPSSTGPAPKNKRHFFGDRRTRIILTLSALALVLILGLLVTLPMQANRFGIGLGASDVYSLYRIVAVFGSLYFVIITFLVSLWWSEQKVGGILRRIENSALHISEGNTDFVFRVRRRDEFEFFARALNDYVTQVERRRWALESELRSVVAAIDELPESPRPDDFKRLERRLDSALGGASGD